LQGELEKLEIVLFASAFGRGGRKGGSVFALPPAEPIARKISSDIFKYTPQKILEVFFLTTFTILFDDRP